MAHWFVAWALIWLNDRNFGGMRHRYDFIDSDVINSFSGQHIKRQTIHDVMTVLKLVKDIPVFHCCALIPRVKQSIDFPHFLCGSCFSLPLPSALENWWCHSAISRKQFIQTMCNNYISLVLSCEFKLVAQTCNQYAMRIGNWCWALFCGLLNEWCGRGGKTLVSIFVLIGLELNIIKRKTPIGERERRQSVSIRHVLHSSFFFASFPWKTTTFFSLSILISFSYSLFL